MEPKKTRIWTYIIAIYLLCFFFRIIEYFFIRTDSTVFGEAFIHKLLGIAILFASTRFLSFKASDLGFARKKRVMNCAIGFLLGLCCYATAYAIEIGIQKASGNFEMLSLFVTSYSVDGNLGNRTGLIFFLICVLGNIINVVMEEGIFRGLFQKLYERRYSFIRSAMFASLLFGFWHCVGPIRSFTDGISNEKQLILNLMILISTSTLIGIKYAMLKKLTGSLFAGMADHFVNNTIINILHVVSPSEIDQLQTVRISIAQTLSFVIVLAFYIVARASKGNAPQKK